MFINIINNLYSSSKLFIFALVLIKIQDMKKEKRETMFCNNQPFEEVLIQAVIFAVSFVFIATFLVALITLIYNLLS
jgi:hypothetical protein